MQNSGSGISDEGCMRCNFPFNEKLEGLAKKDYKMQYVRGKAVHGYRALHDTFYSIKAVFEKHNVVFTIGASLASAGAAWAGYTARQLHQRKVEERLNSIEQAMTTVHNLEVEQVQAITKGIGVSYPACAATATTTLVVGYALGFRGGRRYTLNRIRKQQQKPLALSKLNVTKLSRFSQVFQRAIVRPSRATDPLQANCDTKQDTKQELTLNALEAVGVVEAPKPVIK